MKKVFALLTALVLLLGALPTALAEKEPTTITWILNQDQAGNESWTTKKLPELLKQYGFNVKFEVIPMGTHDGVDWANLFNTYIASGGAPADIVHMGALNTNAVDAGWFVELSEEMIKENMPEYYQAALDIYEYMPAYFRDLRDGKVYCLVSWNMFGPCRHTMVYRKDWLDKLSMEVPKTIDEFEAFLRACRTVDFNGDGELNEYGYTSGTNSPFCGFNEVYAAYGAQPMVWMNKDGKIVRGEMTEGTRAALETLARWYKENLIPKGVNTTETRRDGFNQGIRGSYAQGDGYAPALVQGGQNYEEFYAAQPSGEMIVAPSFKGPNGEGGTIEWGPRKYQIAFGSHLANDPEKLKLCLQILECIATHEDTFEAAMLGEKGTHWDFVEEGATSGATTFLGEYTDYNHRLDVVGVREMSESPYCAVWVPRIYKKYLDPKALEYSSYETGYFDAIGNGVTFEEQIEYTTDLDNLTKEVFMDIITGVKPIESYDEYVKTWYENGGQIMTDAAQELFERNFTK